MDPTDLIWMNGEFVAWEDAKIHVLTHGLHYGTGVFEGVRCYDTVLGPAVFRNAEHVERLRRSAQMFYMDVPFSDEELRNATTELVARNGVKSCYIRPIVYRGYGSMGLNPLDAPVDVTIACSYAFNRSNGTHVFEVEAIDEAGNVDPNPATYSWTIFPATELGSCPYKITASNVATFEFSPVGTAGLSCQCKLDSGSFQSCVSPDSFINLADGSHTFTVRAIDQNGVVDPSPPSYTWTIKTWSSIGISGANVQTVIAASTNPTTIYAGTAQNGVYESTDGGTTWTAINSGLTSNDIMTLAADPVSPAVIYAGTLGGGVFKSVNGGSAWSAANSGLPANSTVYALAIPQQFHQTVYAGLNSGAYKSVNSGSSWSSVSTGLPANTSVRSLSILSTNANVVYAGTDGGGVFETTNGGANWSAENAGLTNLSIYAIALDPKTRRTSYAGTSSGQIFKSLDGGQSWNLINSGLPDAITSFSFEPNNTSIVYAGTLGAGVYESTDGGSTWNLSIGANSNTTWESMVVDTSRQEIISSVGGGVYYRAEIRVPVPALPPFALTVGLVILGTLGWRRVLKRKTDSNES